MPPSLNILLETFRGYGARTSYLDERFAPISFAALADDLDAVQIRGAQLGLNKGVRVATLLPDSARTLMVQMGLMFETSVLPLNPQLSDAELCQLIAQAAASVLIAQADDQRAKQIAEQQGLTLLEPGNFGHLGGPQAQDIVCDPAHVPGLTLLTSGSTGTPKRVALTPQRLLRSAQNIADALELTAHDRALHALPMFHIGALVDLALAPWLAGGSIAICPQRDARSLFSAATEAHVSWMQLVPTMMTNLNASLPDAAFETLGAQLRFIRAVSADLAPDLHRGIETRLGGGTPVIQMYGMTETAGQICSNPLPPKPRQYGSVGVANPASAGPELRILDASGTVLGTGETGEIAVRGQTVFDGYEPRGDGLDAQGWFRTGDLGYLDPDGFLHLTGRAKDMINRGGEKIAPVQIERCAMALSGVDGAAAFAVPHPTLGEQVGLAVVLSGGTNVEDLHSHLRAHLADFKRPRSIMTLDDLPRLAGGKVDKRALMDLAQTQGPAQSVSHWSGPAEQIAAIWSQTLGSGPPESDTDFFDAGGDSLNATQFLAQVSAHLGRDMPPNLLFDHPTFGALITALEAHSAADGPDQTNLIAVPPAIDFIRRAISGWGGTRVSGDSLFHAFGQSRTKPPLFFCAQDFVEIQIVQRAIGADRPFYACRSLLGMPRKTDQDRDDLAMRYADEIESLAGSRAFALGGFCEGGRMVAKILQLLEDRGCIPHMVLSIDHWISDPAPCPVYHVFSNCERTSARMRYGTPQSSAPVLAPHGAQFADISGAHDLLAFAGEPLLSSINAALDMQTEWQPPANTWLTPDIRTQAYRCKLKARGPRLFRPGEHLIFDVTLTNTSPHDWLPYDDSGLAVVAHAINLDRFPRKHCAGFEPLNSTVAPGETAQIQITVQMPDVRIPLYIDVFASDPGLAEFPARPARRLMLPRLL